MTTPHDRKASDFRSPALPRVTRLNRNALVVAGMGVGVVILAVTHVVRSDQRAPVRDLGGGRVDTGQVASFLGDPVQRAEEPPIPAPADSGARAGAPDPTFVPTDDRLDACRPQDSCARSPVAPAEPDLREEAYLRALRAELRGPTGDEPSMRPDMVGLSAADVLAAPEPPPSDSPPLRDVAAQATTRAGDLVRPPDLRQELWNATAEARESIVMAPRLVEPISEYQVMAGTVLPAMMVTAMNSDMPGETVAQISRNVYDFQQRHLLIPRGTRIIGRYDNQITLGQSRVLIAWTRLIFPDGRSLSLPGLPTQDLRGASGLDSRVNKRYGRLYGQAILLSLIGAAAQLSQPQQSNVFGPASPGQIAAGALGQELSRISMETIRRNMDVRPTLEVEAATPFQVFLERDLVLDGPYIDPRANDGSAAPGR